MVKGINRRVVVVRSPDERIFEQAIFIIRDDYLRSEPEGTKLLMNEAQKIANDYARSHHRSARRRRRAPLLSLLLPGLAAAVLLALHFTGVIP